MNLPRSITTLLAARWMLFVQSLSQVGLLALTNVDATVANSKCRSMGSIHDESRECVLCDNHHESPNISSLVSYCSVLTPHSFVSYFFYTKMAISSLVLRSTSALVFFSLFSGFTSVQALSYTLDTEYSGTTFFDGFDFYSVRSACGFCHIHTDQ
jgi:hypothetical protein